MHFCDSEPLARQGIKKSWSHQAQIECLSQDDGLRELYADRTKSSILNEALKRWPNLEASHRTSGYSHTDDIVDSRSDEKGPEPEP